MKRPLLIHCGIDGDYAGMVEDAAERHRAYCERHGFDYSHDRGVQGLEHGSWAKIATLRSLLTEDGPEYIVWLDADALIADVSVDLRDAVPEGKSLGLVVHPFAWEFNGFHFNVGCMYLRNTPDMRAFLDQVWAARGEARLGHWHEQAAINLILMEQLPWQRILCTLPTRWNVNVFNQSCGNAIVAASHGYGFSGDRRRLMRAYVEAGCPSLPFNT